MPVERRSRLLPKPTRSARIVFADHDDLIEPEHITHALVGAKAYGLACLPRLWTVPYVIIHQSLIMSYMYSSRNARAALLDEWAKQVIYSLALEGVNLPANLIVRSSAQYEGMYERGQYTSSSGSGDKLSSIIANCLNELLQLPSQSDFSNDGMTLIVQKFVTPLSARGHLSNERRFYAEKRDWVGTFELTNNQEATFQINLRNWRQDHNFESQVEKILKCNISAHVSKALKIPAAWASNYNVRIHFEWVWDGKTVFIVQADQDNEKDGIDPQKVYILRQPKVASFFSPTVLTEISQVHASKYDKVRNVFAYKSLGLPTTPLYILDSVDEIEKLSKGDISNSLRDDISELINVSLIIRTDVPDSSKAARQMLPRIQVDDVASATAWLISTSRQLSLGAISNGTINFIFLFHNFIPAVASAFAYAAPGERKVQIESLWGLPEGLYYNSHDKYIVDTGSSDSSKLDSLQFNIQVRRNFKGFAVTPNEDGSWTTKKLKPPYDWRRSIKHEDWIREIALQSRRIADAEANPLSIMWLVDVPKEVCSSNIFPWHHELFELDAIPKNNERRTKTLFDKTFTIRDQSHIDILEREASTGRSNIRTIKIEPLGDDILRNRNALQTVGTLARKLGAVIILEGGILSHAYYQMITTGAPVEVLHPFDDSLSKREFNKLVRDKIPNNIAAGGETVRTVRFEGDYHIRLLREKLVEEACEVLDAIDEDAIVGELADVLEIVDAIRSRLEVSKADLEALQKKKRGKAGGFDNGVVLIETDNPNPTSKAHDIPNLFENVLIENGGPVGKLAVIESLSRVEALAEGKKVEKWTDKKIRSTSTEIVMHLSVPLIRDTWEASFSDGRVGSRIGADARFNLRGERKGTRVEIELVVHNHGQLELFLPENL